jgi:hypothetical protein
MLTIINANVSLYIGNVLQELSSLINWGGSYDLGQHAGVNVYSRRRRITALNPSKIVIFCEGTNPEFSSINVVFSKQLLVIC